MFILRGLLKLTLGFYDFATPNAFHIIPIERWNARVSPWHDDTPTNCSSAVTLHRLWTGRAILQRIRWDQIATLKFTMLEPSATYPRSSNSCELHFSQLETVGKKHEKTIHVTIVKKSLPRQENRECANSPGGSGERHQNLPRRPYGPYEATTWTTRNRFFIFCVCMTGLHQTILCWWTKQ